MNEQDKKRLEALEYVVEVERGDFDVLVKNIGKERVDEFCQLGFIGTGGYLKAKTWRVLDLGRKYYEVTKQ